MNIFTLSQARILRDEIELVRRRRLISATEFTIEVKPSATLLERVRVVHGDNVVNVLKMMCEEIK